MNIVYLMQQFYCYILESKEKPAYTYIGATTNLERRLKQHNRLLVGGAKATRKSTWKIACYLTGFNSWKECLACEWRLKHPNFNKSVPPKYNKLEGKVLLIQDVFNSPNFTKNYSINKENIYIISIKNNLAPILQYLPTNLIMEINENFD